VETLAGLRAGAAVLPRQLAGMILSRMLFGKRPDQVKHSL
jgi:hypothetical protein